MYFFTVFFFFASRTKRKTEMISHLCFASINLNKQIYLKFFVLYNVPSAQASKFLYIVPDN